MCYFTISHSLNYVLWELMLWSSISKEHQTFLLTVADLTDKDLSSEIEKDLMQFHNLFEKIENETIRLKEKLQYYYPVYRKLSGLLKRFLIINKKFIPVLEKLKSYGKDEPVWQMLVGHIEGEHRYMEKLFKNLLY
ncbi:hypothetical protein BBF96_09865 [Anoxybacter fermentans]|uniref:Hemerythrin-like domain-containing protein n=1 Tax=Anoxybacter fermentans TaxID=1323375 RepID=A0A3S9SZG0_9FIRM|nr:DUF2935 domain-containing protein [Anoxybacter fermentans]AZR73664.1 hypothetical protein BBF96_09865 [Anoxybacter fermentans]